MSEKFDLKAHLAGECSFIKFRKGNLFYRTALGFEFPVPVADTGDGSFGAVMRGAELMKYIRKHAVTLETARNETAEV